MQDQFFLQVNISKIAMLILEDATSNKEEHVIGDKVVMMTLIGLYLRDSDADLRPVHASITLATQEMATICLLTQFNKFQVRFYIKICYVFNNVDFYSLLTFLGFYFLQ